MATGLYIHVPFCLARCDFCAFYLQVLREDRAQEFREALREEIALHAAARTLGGAEVDTVYFGGGTPTTLPAEELVGILERARSGLRVRPDAEICVEAHPDTVSRAGLGALVHAGFNRISFGVQTADSEELVTIGRPAVGSLPGKAVAAARAAGFQNVNLDLMYGLPGQTMDSWLATLDAAVSLDPTHVSCYALTIETGTKLDRDVRRGVTDDVDTELQNALEDAASRRLREAGFDRYEISNYCRTGAACRHNLLYWQGGDYLGLGPSAQSFVRGSRFGNVEHLSSYVQRLSQAQLPTERREQLDDEQRRREAVVFGLRMVDGISRELLEQIADQPWRERVGDLICEGLIEEHSGRVRLTAFGRRYADSVAVELL